MFISYSAIETKKNGEAYIKYSHSKRTVKSKKIIEFLYLTFNIILCVSFIVSLGFLTLVKLPEKKDLQMWIKVLICVTAFIGATAFVLVMILPHIANLKELISNKVQPNIVNNNKKNIIKQIENKEIEKFQEEILEKATDFFTFIYDKKELGNYYDKGADFFLILFNMSKLKTGEKNSIEGFSLIWNLEFELINEVLLKMKEKITEHSAQPKGLFNLKNIIISNKILIFIEKFAKDQLNDKFLENDVSKIITHGKDIINILKDSDTNNKDLYEKFLKEIDFLEKIDQDFINEIPLNIDAILNFYRVYNFIKINSTIGSENDFNLNDFSSFYPNEKVVFISLFNKQINLTNPSSCFRNNEHEKISHLNEIFNFSNDEINQIITGIRAELKKTLGSEKTFESEKVESFCEKLLEDDILDSFRKIFNSKQGIKNDHGRKNSHINKTKNSQERIFYNSPTSLILNSIHDIIMRII